MKLHLPLALLTLAGAGFAQNTQGLSSSPIREYAGPVQQYQLNYATGKLTKLDDAIQVPTTKEAVSMPSYVNTCTVGSFFPANGFGAGIEVVDYGVKTAGLSTLVDSLTFAYVTDTLDVGMGGTGASLDLAIYSGTGMSGVLGTEVARFVLTGLPGSPDGIALFGTSLTLTGLDFCLPDGPIGYGFCSIDPTTGPFLVDILACPNGAIDEIDAYLCPAPTGGGYLGFGNFATPNIASFFMVINEDDATDLATTLINNGAGGNPLLASDGGVPATLGGTWPVTVDNSAGYGSSIGLWTIGSLAPGSVILVGGEVIVNILDPNGFVITNAVIGAGINDHSEFVPKTTTLLGVDLTFQGLLFGMITPYQLTNGIDIHIGW